MKPLKTVNDILEYKKQIERQKECLEVATAFSSTEKRLLKMCYDDMITICKNTLANQPE